MKARCHVAFCSTPLLKEEGWTRHKKRYREATFDGADGVVRQDETLRLSDHPVCGNKVGFAGFLSLPQPPLLYQEGSCRPAAVVVAIFVTIICFALPAPAQNPDSVLTQIGIDQKLGVQVDPNIEFRDESGQTVRLGDYFGTKPLILTPVYYECPMLCSMLLNGLVKALHVMPFTAGKEFEIISFSIDPNEQSDLAAQKKLHYVRDYGKPQAARGWHFLTGNEKSIHKLAEEIGFRYTYDTYTKQWAHASGIVLLTPAGVISQYFYGIEFDPADLRLSLIQASNQKLGSLTDHILLYCFQYNPTTGKYSIAIMRVLRTLAVATVLLIAGFIFIESRRKRFA